MGGAYLKKLGVGSQREDFTAPKGLAGDAIEGVGENEAAGANGKGGTLSREAVFGHLSRFCLVSVCGHFCILFQKKMPSNSWGKILFIKFRPILVSEFRASNNIVLSYLDMLDSIVRYEYKKSTIDI